MDESSRVVCKVEAGDVVIIHVLVVHRAGHNYTDRSRNAIINEYKTMEAVDEWNNRCAFAGNAAGPRRAPPDAAADHLGSMTGTGEPVSPARTPGLDPATQPQARRRP